MAKYEELHWLSISKERAIENGYEPFEDPEAYGGEVFIKNDIKWIHSINRLKAKLDVETDVELENLGYSTQDYYRLNSDEEEYAPIRSRLEMLEIFSDGAPDEDGAIYLGDGIYMDEDGNTFGDWNR